MEKFQQNLLTDAIIVQAVQGKVADYACRYLKITPQTLTSRLAWFKRQDKKYQERVRAKVKLMDLKVKALYA